MDFVYLDDSNEIMKIVEIRFLLTQKVGQLYSKPKRVQNVLLEMVENERSRVTMPLYNLVLILPKVS